MTRHVVKTPQGYVALGSKPVRRGFYVAETPNAAYACSREQADAIAKEINRGHWLGFATVEQTS